MICPKCNAGLLLANTQGVEIDHCPNCKGVWLDRGELDKIIERSGSYGSMHGSDHREFEDRSNHSDHSDHYQEHDRYPKRRKNFMSELFDF